MFFVEKLSLGLLFFPPHPSLGKIHKNIILGLFVISILEKSLGNMKIAFLVNESWILYWYHGTLYKRWIQENKRGRYFHSILAEKMDKTNFMHSKKFKTCFAVFGITGPKYLILPTKESKRRKKHSEGEKNIVVFFLLTHFLMSIFRSKRPSPGH